MAVLGHLGPLQPLRPVGCGLWANQDPFSLSRWVPNHNLAPNPIKPKKSIKTLRTHFGQGPPEATRSAQLNPSPQLQGDSSHSSMHPLLKIAGVVHIWYYIPLCTISAKKFNGDALRTKFHNSKSRSQNPTPI
ncbi:hypothetical protein O181_095943 [Austropuccinia psidii MF-1]|uniref:Uncharacterized protein n=1 Tax=Austropuccinia psidii MF-1 TaxID=1389203 RepID=A0A9Q3J624_9BASI|nr:hypothetical protein [Austropuccinia psidii MF-1]